MTAKFGILFTLLFVCFHAIADGDPTAILFKGYTVQCRFLDSLNQELNEKGQNQAITGFQNLEKWATKKGDQNLVFAIQLNRLNHQLLGLDSGDDYNNRNLAVIVALSKNCSNEIRADAFQLLGEYYWKTKNYPLAIENYLYAYNCYKDLTFNEYPHKSDFLYTLGGKYYFFRDFDTAKKYFLEVWTKNINPNHVNNGISKLNTLALCYGYLEKLDSSIFYFKEALSLAKNQNNELWEGIISGNLGNSYLKQNKTVEAKKLFEKNIELSKKHNAKTDLIVSLSGYGDLLLRQNLNKKALEQELKALDLMREFGLSTNDQIKSRVYPNLAKALAENGQLELAYRYLDTAVSIKKEEDKERNLVYIAGVQNKLDLEKHLAAIRLKDSEAKQQMNIRNGILIGSGILLLLVLFILRNLKEQTKLNFIINSEKLKSESLLLNILPSEIAEELKQNGRSEAKLFESTTVVFTDFVNFTKISEQLDPKELVAELHKYFTEFDRIIEKHGLEKIKTIGDAYLAVSGLPIENSNHAFNAINASIEIIDFVNNEIKNGGHFSIRIGINSGPVVAGIVGSNKFAYDIWGDTVNVAARMEQSSEKGKINISQSTFEQVEKLFNFTPRGEIEAKNKGKIKMYFIEQSLSSKIKS